MRSPINSRIASAGVGAVLAMGLVIASTAAVDAKPPPKPPKPTPTPTPTATATPTPPAVSITAEIAPTGTLEPSRQYSNVDVTVTCPVGWTWTRGSLYVRQAEPGGSGSFTSSCTGAPQVAHSRVVNGNKWVLGAATATAYVTITRSGREVTASSTRTISLEPGVTARIADQGQLTGTGEGVKIAVAVACPTGATGQPSSISVSQGTTAQGSGTFTPLCDGTSRTFVVSIGSSTGSFQTGSATSAASASVTWNGQGFSGADSRAITLLESSTGDTTPPTAPNGLGANVFGDGETWLSWGASTDNATPTGLIVYEVFLNGQFDQGIGGGQTQAILYADQGRVNTIEVVAVDGAGNRSAPASVMVDCSPGGCQ
jgi:hypothetical protein